ncbi:MAG: hypothetical protein ACXWV2_06015 [Chitinophagaceae bacterium]
MEKILRNNRVIAIAFFTAFSVSAIQDAKAGDNSKTIPVEMKFMGHLNNQLLFKLNFTGNPEQNEFTIIIRDEKNHILYRENIKGENFSKSFLVNAEEIGDNMLTFEIVSKKSKESVVFEVNRTTRVTEEMTVGKL